jgi:acyl carrier protein
LRVVNPAAIGAKNIQGGRSMDRVEKAVRGVLSDVLGISKERVAAFDGETPLFGALPELDSMAVAGLLTELEDRLDIIVEDDEVDGELLESFGALLAFAQAKVAA